MSARLTIARLARRSAAHRFRSSALAALASAAATAAIVGALLVGDSLRGSLAGRVEERLGAIDAAVVAETPFRAILAREVEGSGGVERAAAAIVLRGQASSADAGRVASGLRVMGVGPDFWSLWPLAPGDARELAGALEGRKAAIGRALAEELGVQEGDELVVRFERLSDVPAEYALGRRGERAPGLRVEIARVIPDEGPALFDLELSQRAARNVFLPIGELARTFRGGSPAAGGVANCLLLGLAGDPGREDATAVSARALEGRWTLEDWGLRLRLRPDLDYAALESREILLPRWVEAAVGRAAKESSGPTFSWLPVLAYLANAFSAGGREIPYATVAAVGPSCGGEGGSPLGVEPPGLGEIVLSDWAGEDLGARAGDAVRMRFYAVEAREELVEEEAAFVVRGIVPLEGAARDPGWVPEYPGISDARSVREWDPPIPVDFSRVRDRDEEYWKVYRTTPKAFVSLADGRRLWSSRFGDLTSVRFRPPPGVSLEELARDLEARLPRSVALSATGVRFLPLRADGLAAASGSTDFGGLFLALSAFLIASALILLALIVRLACERRSREIGILAAVGFSPGAVRRLLVLEGVWVAAAGTALGLLGGLGYAALLVEGLRTFWRGAVNAPFLALHVRAASLVAGGAVTALLSVGTMAFASSRAAEAPPRRLLAGPGTSWDVAGRPGGRAPRRARRIAAGAGLVAAGLLAAGALGRGVAPPVAFFGSGAALLVASLAASRSVLGGPRRSLARGRGLGALVRLGLGSAKRDPGRSLSSIALVASATFLVGSVSANRLEPSGEPRRSSGDGGFALAARSSVPLTASLRTRAGRESLGLGPETARLLERADAYAFRLSEGDDASCLNVYRPLRPRILGAREEFIRRGGFAWASSLSRTEEERANPWLLLEREFEDGAIPAVADASSAQWALHLALGGDLAIEDALGRERKLRLVATLSGSIFQGEVLVAEGCFLDLFPGAEGDRFFLFEVPLPAAADLASGLERDLSAFGFDVETTAAVLRAYRSVANTYLSTFELLGWMGLLLGTLGLGAVLARNVDERRGELALLRAVGYSRAAIGFLVLAETVGLLFAGLAAGGVASLASLLPVSARAGGGVSLGAFAASLAAIAAAGTVSSGAALLFALRGPLIPALRSE